MSMPSSSELVATTQRIRPVFSASSTIARCSLDTEPWWARAKSETVPASVPEPPISCAGAGAVVAGPSPVAWARTSPSRWGRRSAGQGEGPSSCPRSSPTTAPASACCAAS